jgi:F420-dependent oxidoreductase-like protein
MKLSLLFPETRRLPVVRELAARTEAQGFHGMWIGSAFGFDPFVALALAGPATSTVELGVAVVPTWPRHPVVMAQQAASASAACGGRFRLGVGASHAPVMRMYGIDFDRPIGHLREYLAILQALLHDGRVAHDGERYQVNAFLDVADAPAPPVLLGVLREQSARLAGAYADGALAWLCPADYTRKVIATNLAVGAASSERPTPPLVAELPCALTTDRDAVHAMAVQDLGVYPHMPFYRGIFEACGIEVVDRKWNDAMIDATVLYGDEDGLAAKIQSFVDAGADEVVLSPFGVGPDPQSSQADCISVLADLAGSR